MCEECECVQLVVQRGEVTPKNACVDASAVLGKRRRQRPKHKSTRCKKETREKEAKCQNSQSSKKQIVREHWAPMEPNCVKPRRHEEKKKAKHIFETWSCRKPWMKLRHQNGHWRCTIGSRTQDTRTLRDRATSKGSANTLLWRCASRLCQAIEFYAKTCGCLCLLGEHK